MTLYLSPFRELLSSGMEDFEQKLFDFLCDHNQLVSIDRFKNVSTSCFCANVMSAFSVGWNPVNIYMLLSYCLTEGYLHSAVDGNAWITRQVSFEPFTCFVDACVPIFLGVHRVSEKKLT